MKVTPAVVIKAFIETRDEIDRRKKELESYIKEQNKVQEARTNWLKKHLRDNGLKNIATDFGTAYPSSKVSVRVADKEAFRKFLDEGNWEFADIRASKTAVCEIVQDEDNPQPPPPGVDYTSWSEITVQRPKGKKGK